MWVGLFLCYLFCHVNLFVHLWLLPHYLPLCPLVVRLKLKQCEHPSFALVFFLFKLMLAILSILDFDVSFSINSLFPHKSLLEFEMKVS